MSSLKLALDLCREVSRQLDEIGHHTPEGGVDCLAYTDRETEAVRLVAAEAARLGARVFQDEAGNVSIVKEGKNPELRAVMGGSHLDAVPRGGQ